MNKKKIIILGATGFIGRNIVEYFAGKKQFEVFAVFNKKNKFLFNGIKWIKADLRNERNVKNLFKDIDIVIQAAATTSGAKDIKNKPYIHVTDNAVMNSLILRSVFASNVKHFIFFSCTVMYQSSIKPVKESEFNESKEIYYNYFGVGWTKVYIEKMCKFYSNISNTKFTVIRHSNIYGDHDKYDLEKSHVFGATITKVMTSKSKITIWGKGNEGRDLLHVSDLINFVHMVINRQKNNYEIFNVGLGKAIKIKKLVSLIIKISKKNLFIEHDLSKPSFKTSLSLNCNKAKKLIGWEPKILLNEGILKTLKWWKLQYKSKNLSK